MEQDDTFEVRTRKRRHRTAAPQERKGASGPRAWLAALPIEARWVIGTIGVFLIIQIVFELLKMSV